MFIKRDWVSFASIKAFLFYLMVIGTPLLFFTWRLGSQTSGFNQQEAATRTAAKLSNIVDNPLFAPYKITENIMFHIGDGSIFALRITSVLFALLILGVFFYLLKAWFGKPIAFLTILLLALTPLFTLSARTATPIVMYTFPISLLLVYQLLKKRPLSLLAQVLFVVILALNFYIPGAIWLIVIGGIFWFGSLRDILIKDQKLMKSGLFVLLLALISPLIISFVKDFGVVKQWLLIPSQLPAPLEFAKNLAWTVSDIFFRLRTTESLSIERLPVLNIAQIGLFVFGAYVIWTRLRKQFYWLFSSLLIILILAALNNNFEILIYTLPFIAFICGMGLRYLFVEWRSVFPKNPLAKWFAIALMFGIITIHIFYGVRYSLLAWPASEHIKQSYVIK